MRPAPALLLASALALALATPAPALAAPAPAPARVVSLNLCSDELALLLAAPGQLVGVSRLGADPLESVLAARARGLPANRGRVTDVVGLRPDLVLTSGGDPSAAATARRLGMAVVELPQPQTLDAVFANVRRVAAALGRPAAGASVVAAMHRDLGLAAGGAPIGGAGAPAEGRAKLGTPALLVGGGGMTVAADGLAAAWLAHAGLVQQAVPRGAVSLERLLVRPPQVLVVSRYRHGQVSIGQSWLSHRALAALPRGVRQLATDGRAWTCLGPTLGPEIARLRALVGSPPVPARPLARESGK